LAKRSDKPGNLAAAPVHGQGVIDHSELIGTRVRHGVAGTEHAGEGFAGGVEEQNIGWNPKPRL
jgi:hypothetical protein